MHPLATPMFGGRMASAEGWVWGEVSRPQPTRGSGGAS